MLHINRRRAVVLILLLGIALAAVSFFNQDKLSTTQFFAGAVVSGALIGLWAALRD